KGLLHMAYYPEFAHLLNQELQRQDRSSSWLAQRLHVSPSTVARWLNHGTRPGAPEVVARVADILGVTAQKQALLAAAGFGYRPAAQDVPGADSIADRPGTPANLRAARLPIPVTPLVGRSLEKARLVEWIRDAGPRLVTIVGPGGMGKTRLALDVASERAEAEQFEHGVAFVDMAPLSELDQMPAAIAQALGLPLESGSNQTRSPQQQVIDFLSARHLLLLLDNAEHLLDGAPFIADILAGAPGVQILVTSRAPLRLVGEQLYPLGGLETSDPLAQIDRESASASALFVQSAHRVRPGYRQDAEESRSIAEICRLVEGMPLAIELAASWVTLLSAGDILAAIRRSLHFLETDLRGVPARHRSMQAVFDATWQRLNETERKIFAQLSVFRGGFSQDAVHRVTAAELSQLRSLAASSLIVYSQDRGRYTIHELLRQYGALRLAELPELDAATHAAHSDFYFDLLRRRQNALKNRGLQTDLQVLDAEMDNLSRAWHWAAAHGRVDGLSDTLDGFGLYLQWRGRSAEGEAAFRAVAAALAETGERQKQARALAWQSLFARVLGQHDSATQLLSQCRRLLAEPSLAEADVRPERAFVLMQLGAAAAASDTQAALTYYRESLALFESISEAWFAAEVLLGLGHVCLLQGDFPGQRAYVQKALDTYRTLGNVRGAAFALSMLADIDSYRGRPLSGLELGFEALAAFRALGDPIGIATCQSRIGMTYINLGDVFNARQIVMESAARFAEIGSRRDEVIAYAFLCAIELMAGAYGQALAYAERSHSIARQLDDQFVLGVAVGFFGLGTALHRRPAQGIGDPA
ncbi:MAG: AAA family ATPase, partial [Caldilineaceae bacterium]